MKKSYLFLLACLFCCAISSCSKDPDKEPDPTLVLSPTTTAVIFSADGQTATSGGTALIPTFTVTTNQTAWDVRVTPTGSWCTATKNGSTFTLTAVANTLTTPPGSAMVTVTAGNAQPIIISVTQFGAGEALAILPEVETLEFTASGTKAFAGTQEIVPAFAVATNLASWEVAVTPTGSWCTATKTEDGNGFTLTAARNTSEQVPEQATVTVTAGEATPVTFTVTQKKAVYDIYAIGKGSTGYRYSAWKNETKLFDDKGLNWVWRDLAVKNGTVFICGEIKESPSSRPKAAVWKNGEILHQLEGSTFGVQAYGICLVGSDIYTAGVEYVSAQGELGHRLWENKAQKVTLPLGTEEVEYIQRIAFQDGYFYLAVTDVNSTPEAAKLVKVSKDDMANISIIPLPATGMNAYLYDMALGSNGVYLCGTVSNRPVLWHMDPHGNVSVQSLLPNTTVNMIARDVSVSGDDVYVAVFKPGPQGKNNSVMVLKNGSEVPEYGRDGVKSTVQMAVAGGSVYILDDNTFYKNGIEFYTLPNLIDIQFVVVEREE